MISLSSASLRRGRRLLLDAVSVTIHPGERVGIVGRNGCGKSSLFDALRGELALDGGRLHVPEDLEVASLRQEMPTSSRPALEFIKDGDPDLREIERAIAQADRNEDGTALARLYADLEAIDGYRADARAAKLLVGLGFSPGDEQRAVDEFSGGWRMRLGLAQALMHRSDLLLLDEPTNHLDLESVLWLADWLRRYEGTLLVISHDRDFLDRVVQRVLHLTDAGIDSYAGTYSDFERARAERLAHQRAAHERQERERDRIQRFVERFRAKATKARQAQSRIRTLERMAETAAVRIDSPYRFDFPETRRCPDPLLSLSAVAVGYGETPVLSDVHLTLHPGDRLALIGPNGAGKSSLVRILAGRMAPIAGRRVAHPGLEIGYFAQDELEQLDLEATPLLSHRRQDPAGSEQALRDFIGRFGFGGELAEAPLTALSGGEKSRLVLSLLVRRGPNLLLLDEPTNHLDLEMREALASALQGFEGAVVLVAHDLHLLRSTAEELVLLEAGTAARFAGDVNDYERIALRHRLGDAPARALPAAADGAGGPPAPASRPSPPRAHIGAAGSETRIANRKDERRARAAERDRKQPRAARLRTIEAALARLAEETAAIDDALSDPGIYDTPRKDELERRLAARSRAAAETEALEAEWLALQEAEETGVP